MRVAAIMEWLPAISSTSLILLLLIVRDSEGRPNSDLDFNHHDPNAKNPGRCEAVTIPMCKDMPYNETFLPNNLGHATQEEAGYEAHQYYALVKVSSIISF